MAVIGIPAVTVPTRGDLHTVAACEPYGSVLVISLFKKTFCGEIIYISMGC